MSFLGFLFFLFVWMDYKKRERERAGEESFSFPPPSRCLMSRGATGNAKKAAQPTTQRTAPVSLRCFKLFSKNTGLSGCSLRSVPGRRKPQGASQERKHIPLLDSVLKSKTGLEAFSIHASLSGVVIPKRSEQGSYWFLFQPKVGHDSG